MINLGQIDRENLALHEKIKLLDLKKKDDDDFNFRTDYGKGIKILRLFNGRLQEREEF
jgi:hypothetical protein